MIDEAIAPAEPERRTKLQLPYPPLTLTRSQAVAYSGLSPSLVFKIVKFRAYGPRGALVCLTDDLAQAVRRMFGSGEPYDDWDDEELAGMPG